MLTKKMPLWASEEYTFENPVPFAPFLTAYLHEKEETCDRAPAPGRPAILVIPGGAYCLVSCTEGEPVAKAFYEKGYNTFVLVYTTNLLMDRPLGLQPLSDAARAIAMIRRKAGEFDVDPSAVAVCGFSAGGHLAGSLTMHFNDPALEQTGAYDGISVRPDASILCYPVITAGEYAHRDSFKALLGPAPSPEALTYMSLETQVTEDTPPVFLWHCEGDTDVSPENSLLMEKVMKAAGLPVELHLFTGGKHGMSLANRAWAKGPLVGLYTMQQYFDDLQDLCDRGEPMPFPYNTISLPPHTDIKALFEQNINNMPHTDEPDPAVALWPTLADLWLKRVLDK